MAEWAEFEAAMPVMAAKGRALFYQFGVGLGFLATVRRDGGPRLHPICPVIAAGGLWAFIGNTPKRRDLLRDGRFALHSMPPEKVDDEFYLTGTVRLEPDESLRAEVMAAYLATGATSSGDELFFGFDIERAMLAVYETRPQWPPAYTKWSAP